MIFKRLDKSPDRCKVAYFQHRSVYEEWEEKKQIEHGVVVLLLDAEYVDWVDDIDGKLFGYITVGLVPWIEVELEDVLDNDQHLLTTQLESPASNDVDAITCHR